MCCCAEPPLRHSASRPLTAHLRAALRCATPRRRPPPATRAEASSLIDEYKEKEKAARAEGPPSEKQLAYLADLGYEVGVTEG